MNTFSRIRKDEPTLVKVITYYKNVSFGIEVTKEEALQISTSYINKDVEVIEVEGYYIYPRELTKLELFDVD